jgi:hypothetical protein
LSWKCEQSADRSRLPLSGRNSLRPPWEVMFKSLSSTHRHAAQQYLDKAATMADKY